MNISTVSKLSFLKKSERPKGYQIEKVRSQEQRLECFKLRYDVYFREQGCNDKFADHLRATAHDELDESAVILAAYKNGILAGTGRINFSSSSKLPHGELYDYARFQGEIAVASKLMISSAFRHTGLFLRMMQSHFDEILREGARTTIIGCKAELIPMYEKFGFRNYKKSRFYPNHGMITPLYLDNYDLDYLEYIKSPFTPILTRTLGTKQGSESNETMLAAV